MANRTYRLSEIVGTSESGLEDAIRNGIARATKTIRHLDWFEVTDIRGEIVNGEIEHFQVAMKIGFRLEDE
jgi:dodecin